MQEKNIKRKPAYKMSGRNESRQLPEMAGKSKRRNRNKKSSFFPFLSEADPFSIKRRRFNWGVDLFHLICGCPIVLICIHPEVQINLVFSGGLSILRQDFTRIPILTKNSLESFACFWNYFYVKSMELVNFVIKPIVVAPFFLLVIIIVLKKWSTPTCLILRFQHKSYRCRPFFWRSLIFWMAKQFIGLFWNGNSYKEGPRQLPHLPHPESTSACLPFSES